MTGTAFDLDHADTVALLERQTELLERIAAGTTLPEVLGAITETLEDLVPGARCSVLLLDPGGTTLHHGAAPSLPPEYSSKIDGMAIGAEAGSCGTAAYLGSPVVAEDIDLDPRWLRFRDLATPHGLRSCWSTPICGRGGVLGTFAVYHDRTHRPSPREERLVDRLTHLASVAIEHEAARRERRARLEAEVARAAAESASHAKSRFVAALGHELRTPLQAISGFAELLGTLDLPASRRTAALEHISGATTHILSLVDDVLDVARIEAGALPTHPADVVAGALADEVLELLTPMADDRDVVLRHEPAGGPGTPAVARADPRRLRQVLINLVGNGIRYNSPGGRVAVTATRAGDEVRIVVRDSGRGIPEEVADRIFVPFDRLDRDGPTDEGVGLGLPLARGLVEAMGGTLVLRSVVDRGTTVVVTLPAAR